VSGSDPGVSPVLGRGAAGRFRPDFDTEPQPDGLLLIEPARGGQATIDSDGYVAGGPELATEVAASTVSIDRNAKKRAYARNGVREDVLWRVQDAALDWFAVRGAQ